MRKTFNAARALGQRGYRKAAALGTGLALAAGSALAEVPTDVTSAIAETKTDSVSVATLMVGISAALLVFAIIRRLLK